MLRAPVVVLALFALQDFALHFLRDSHNQAEAFRISRAMQRVTRSHDVPVREFSWFAGSLEACLLSLGDQAFPPEGEVYCNATWDMVLCWPAVKAGSSVYQPCPPLRGLDPRKYAEKVCGPTGQWEGREPGDYSKPQGWTNYSKCYTPAALELYYSMFKTEE